MGYKYYDGDEKRLQKKLIPLNIFVAVLALVAAISLMVTPLIRMDLGAAMSSATEMAKGEIGGSGEDNSPENAILDALGSLDAVIEINPLGIANIAFAEQDKKAEIFMDEFIIKSGLLSGMMTTMVNVMIIATAQLSENANVNASALVEKLKDIDNAGNKAEFDRKMTAYINLLEQQAGADFDADTKQAVTDMFGDMYDITVEKVGEGNFSLEAMICVAASGGISSGDGETTATTQVVTNYKDLLNGLIDGTIGMPGGEENSETADSLKDAVSMLNDVAGYYGYLFYAILFFAAIWAILFLFSFFHMFAKNKRFTMWYAKLFGGLPCVIFGVMPLIGNLLIGNLMGETGAAMAGIFGAISSMTWISGVCYLLMWLVSIFWAFPIKRKIRKLRN